MIINISYLIVIISLAKVIIYHLFFPGRAKQFVLLGFIILDFKVDIFIDLIFILFASLTAMLGSTKTDCH